MEVKFNDIIESTFINSKLKHDAKNCIVYGMAILGNTSVNSSYKKGKGRKYSEQALNSTARLVNDVKSFVNHATKKELEERGGIRKVEDILGFFQEGRVENEIVKANLHYNPCHQKWFGWLVDNMSDKIGGSIHGYGPSSFNESTLFETVQDIKILRSTDIVTEPGSTNNLFESLNKDRKGNMEYQNITLMDLKENRPDLVTNILKGYEESAKTKKEIKEREDKIEALTKEVKTLKESVDKYQVKEVLAKKEIVIDKKLEESKLPKEVITDIFKSQLMEAKDDKTVDAFIKDRKTFIKESSSVKGMGDENDPDKELDIKESVKDYVKGIEGVEIK